MALIATSIFYYGYIDDCQSSYRDVRWQMEDRNYLPGNAFRSRLGDDSRLEPANGTSHGTNAIMSCLYTLIVIFFDAMPWSNQHVRVKQWLGQERSTFSDMILSVRRYHVDGVGFCTGAWGQAVHKLLSPLRKLIDFGLAQAAQNGKSRANEICETENDGTGDFQNLPAR